MFKKILFFSIVLLLPKIMDGQNAISSMQWDKDYQLYIQLANDSNYILDIKELHHANTTAQDQESFTYFPVRLGNDFVEKLKSTNIDEENEVSDSLQVSNKTLWSAIHSSIGGGWIHFLNCILYSLETGQLSITSPLMKRPDTNWKPKPITDSYKRTKKWEYYVPVKQKYAIKEYKKKRANNELGNVNDIPQEFIELFLSTSDREYRKMIKENNKSTLAKINMIKIILGANYLGEAQIKYIKSRVLQSFSRYSENILPSIIIFDDFNAAVAMSLNEKGYQVDKIVFADERYISLQERLLRIHKIETIVDQINTINKDLFQQRLSNLYN